MNQDSMKSVDVERLLRKLRSVDDGIVRYTRRELVEMISDAIESRIDRTSEMLFELKAPATLVKNRIKPYINTLKAMNDLVSQAGDLSTRSSKWTRTMTALRRGYTELAYREQQALATVEMLRRDNRPAAADTLSKAA